MTKLKTRTKVIYRHILTDFKNETFVLQLIFLLQGRKQSDRFIVYSILFSCEYLMRKFLLDLLLEDMNERNGCVSKVSEYIALLVTIHSNMLKQFV